MNTSTKRYNYFIIVGTIIFFLTYYLIAPFIHELGHIAVLKYNSCSYWVDYDFNIYSGLTATIYLLKCELTPKMLSLLLIAGVAATTIMGILLMKLDILFIKKDIMSCSVLLIFSSLGFFASTITVFLSGDSDIVNISSLVNELSPTISSRIIAIVLAIYILIHFARSLKYIADKDRPNKKRRKNKKGLTRDQQYQDTIVLDKLQPKPPYP